jgi:hypothetical protein
MKQSREEPPDCTKYMHSLVAFKGTMEPSLPIPVPRYVAKGVLASCYRLLTVATIKKAGNRTQPEQRRVSLGPQNNLYRFVSNRRAITTALLCYEAQLVKKIACR